VGDAAGELPDRLHLLRLQEPSLEIPPVRDVHHETAQPPAVATRRRQDADDVTHPDRPAVLGLEPVLELVVLVTGGRLAEEEGGLGLGVRGLFLRELKPLGLRPLPLGDVADDRNDERPVRRLHGAEADLHGELGAVLAQAVEIEVDTHRPRAGVLDIAGPVMDVGIVESRGDEDLDLAADELVPRVAEEALRLLIQLGDPAACVDEEDRVRRRLEQGVEMTQRHGCPSGAGDGRRIGFYGCHWK
jgi:hypothetical protein